MLELNPLLSRLPVPPVASLINDVVSLAYEYLHLVAIALLARRFGSPTRRTAATFRFKIVGR